MYIECDCHDFKRINWTVQNSKSLIQLELFHNIRDQNMQRVHLWRHPEKWFLDTLQIITPHIGNEWKLYSDI